MLPRDLKPECFNGYPPEAKKLITGYIAALQPLPLSFVPSLLREVIDYDFRFPVERKALERELENLKSLSAGGTDGAAAGKQSDWFQGFSEITISAKLEQ